jgi:transposase-like protein
MRCKAIAIRMKQVLCLGERCSGYLKCDRGIFLLMNASLQFCPNETCCARGQIGVGTISIHGRKRPRYRCHACGKTFSERKGTTLEGLRTDEETVQRVITLLAYRCPRQAVVHAFELDERTVASWQKRAGIHCKHIHEEIVQQGKVRSQHIRADEIRAKGRKVIVWMAFAMDVASRLWLAGVVTALVTFAFLLKDTAIPSISI